MERNLTDVMSNHVGLYLDMSGVGCSAYVNKGGDFVAWLEGCRSVEWHTRIIGLVLAEVAMYSRQHLRGHLRCHRCACVMEENLRRLRGHPHPSLATKHGQ